MSKPTEPIERAKAYLIANALLPLPEIAANHAAAEVERELAAYRERLRKAVEAMELVERSGNTNHYAQAKADVLELIGEMK